jgi:hypothetical protein
MNKVVVKARQLGNSEGMLKAAMEILTSGYSFSYKPNRAERRRQAKKVKK